MYHQGCPLVIKYQFPQFKATSLLLLNGCSQVKQNVKPNNLALVVYATPSPGLLMLTCYDIRNTCPQIDLSLILTPPVMVTAKLTKPRESLLFNTQIIILICQNSPVTNSHRLQLVVECNKFVIDISKYYTRTTIN